MSELARRLGSGGSLTGRTLQEASILWMVTQTATTLSTGDHSLPKIEAHICMETEAGDERQGELL